MLLTAPRDQLSRISSRLMQVGGLSNLDVAWELFAFSHVAVSAAIESAFSQAVTEAMNRLRERPTSSLSSTQVAAITEASFVSFLGAEQARGRFKPNRAMAIRALLVDEIRGHEVRIPRPSVLEKSGIPSRDHFRLFFAITTGGKDPREANDGAPLERLVGRINQVAGPRHVFAHECAEPSQYEFAAGVESDRNALAAAVSALEEAISDLLLLFDALEAACRTV